jgi:hypothetical protein
MLLRYAPMRSEPSAQQRPQPFDRMDVHVMKAVTIVISRILTAEMANRLVRIAPCLQTSIDVIGIGEMPAPNVMAACWTLASIVMATSPPGGIMPKIGGFSPASVPLPRAPWRWFRRPSCPVIGPPQEALYAQPSEIFHHASCIGRAPGASNRQSRASR